MIVAVILLSFLLLLVLVVLLSPSLRKRLFKGIRRLQGKPAEVKYVDLGLKDPRSPIYSKNVYANYMDEDDVKLDLQTVDKTVSEKDGEKENKSRSVRGKGVRVAPRVEKTALNGSFRETDRYNSINDPSDPTESLMMQEMNVKDLVGGTHAQRKRNSSKGKRSSMRKGSRTSASGRVRPRSDMPTTDLSTPGSRGRNQKRSPSFRSSKTPPRQRSPRQGVTNPAYSSPRQGERVRPYISEMVASTGRELPNPPEKHNHPIDPAPYFENLGLERPNDRGDDSRQPKGHHHGRKTRVHPEVEERPRSSHHGRKSASPPRRMRHSSSRSHDRPARLLPEIPRTNSRNSVAPLDHSSYYPDRQGHWAEQARPKRLLPTTPPRGSTKANDVILPDPLVTSRMMTSSEDVRPARRSSDRRAKRDKKSSLEAGEISGSLV